MSEEDSPYRDATRNIDNWGRCRDVFFDGDSVSGHLICKRLIEISESVNTIPGSGSTEDLWTQVKMFQGWMNMRLEDDWFIFREGLFEDEEEFYDFFVELYEKNDVFRSNIQSKYKPPSIEPYQGKDWFEIKSIEQVKELEEEEEEMEHYGKVEEIGIVDSMDGKTVHEDKLRGAMLAFAKQVDEISHKRDFPHARGAKEAFQRWMLEKCGDDWTRFMLDFNTILQEHADYLWENHDEFKELVEQKWVHEPLELEGNGNREVNQGSNGWRGISDWSDELGTVDSPENSNGVYDEQDENDDGIIDIHEVGGSKLIHGDSTKVVPSLDNNSVDALITDPPYGQDYDSRGEQHEVIEGDDDLGEALGMTEEVLKKARMCLTDGSPVVVFCGKTNLPGVIKMVKRWYDFLDINVWHKGYVGTSQIGGTPVKWRPMHEYAVLGMYGDAKYENENRHDGNVWEFQRLSGQNMNHPTEKPVELLEYIINSLTVEGDTVLDPFSGSGSTLIAARRIQREFVGVEYDEQYYDHIKDDRLSQNTLEAF